MPTPVVQSTINRSSTGAPSATLSGVVSGHRVVAIVICDSTSSAPTLSSITDNGSSIASNADFALASVRNSHNGDYETIGVYSLVDSGQGTHAVAATISLSASTALVLLELSGNIQTLDVAAGAPAASNALNTSVLTPTITTSKTGDVVLGIGFWGSSTYIAGFSNSYAECFGDAASDPAVFIGYLDQSAPGSTNTTITANGSVVWGSFILAYGPSGGGSSQKGGMFFADNFRPKIPAIAAAMFMPLSWSINRRNKLARERQAGSELMTPPRARLPRSGV